MYQFVSGVINITDLNIDVEWRVCTTLLVSQLLVCIWSYFVYALITGLLLTSKSQNMIIVLEFPNGKIVNWEVQQNLNDHTYKLRKPSFTANATSPRMLIYAKPCPKSTCYRFKFHLRIIPGRGKCILRSLVVMITWPAKFNLCAKL